MKKLIAMALTTVLVTFALTACGNEDKEKETAGSSLTNTETAASDKQNEADGNKVFVVGTNAEFPPFEYVGDDGQPDGFDIALMKAIGEKMGVEIKFENMEFNSLVASIGSKIDAAIAGMTIDEERSQTVDFSDPYYTAIQYVIVSADSEIAKASEVKNASITDLENKKIGAQLGTTGDLKIEEIQGATPQQYNKGVDAVNDLINGRVDLVIIDKNPAMVFVDKFEGKLVAIDGAEFGFEPEDYAIALPKGSDLTEKVNNALAELKADGTFDSLVEKYIEKSAQ